MSELCIIGDVNKCIAITLSHLKLSALTLTVTRLASMYGICKTQREHHKNSQLELSKPLNLFRRLCQTSYVFVTAQKCVLCRHTHTLSLSLSLTHTHTRTLSHIHSHTHTLSLSLTHTHTLTHARTHTHTHNCPKTHIHCTLCQLAGKVFTHKCDTGNLSALIQC